VVLIGSSLPLLLFLIGLLWPGVVHLSPSAHGRFDLLELARPGVLERGPATVVLGSLLLVGALVRIGCFPLHIWIAPLSESGLGTLSLVSFSTPLGIFFVVRVLMPVFPELCQHVFPYLLPFGLLTALYGVIVALGQHDLRRALGFFWISQQGFLLSGLSSLTTEGASGALLHAIETVVARTGLLLVAAAIAARVGTTDIRFLGGLVARAPRMSTGFLLLSAAAIGLPGTMGFVSEDLIIQGLLSAHGLAATVLLVATALNGILLFRLFQRVFLGAPSSHNAAQHLREFVDLRSRERWVSICLVGLLLAGGLVAAPLLAVRQSVVTALPISSAGGQAHGN
jgi:NADH-quinone oxidoreductase subunit M